MAAPRASKILTVCSGNICRSPMAEGVLRSLLQEAGLARVEIRSAGTLGIVGSPPAEHAVIACRERDVDITDLRSSALDGSTLAWADVVLAMSNSHLGECRALAPGGGARLVLLGEYGRPERPEIEDPVGQDLPAFRRCRDVIFTCAREFVRRELSSGG